jgi:hypothetical protein
MPRYIEVLADLRLAFGKKIFLTPSDIAPVIGRSTKAQSALRARGGFPIPYSRFGRLIVIKIYDLAQYIAIEQVVALNPTSQNFTSNNSRESKSSTSLPTNTRRIPFFAKKMMEL